MNGWNSQDSKMFEQLLIKANDEQLQIAIRTIKNEINSRFGRAWREIDYDEE